MEIHQCHIFTKSAAIGNHVGTSVFAGGSLGQFVGNLLWEIFISEAVNVIKFVNSMPAE